MVFRARDLLVRQRTQTINAIRGHLAEYGWVAPQGVCYVERLMQRQRGGPVHDLRRDGMQKGVLRVMVPLCARMCSAIPGAMRSQAASVASGVTSRGPNPVPPVVSTTSAWATSVSSTMAAVRAGASSAHR